MSYPSKGRYLPQRTRAKERSDILASVVAFGMAAIFALGEIVLPVVQRAAIPAEVGKVAGPAARDGGNAIAAEGLSTTAKALLWAAHAAGPLLLVVLSLVCILVAVNYLRGDFFTRRTYRLLNAGAVLLIVWIVVPGLLGAMGGNQALVDLGLPVDDSFRRFNMSTFVIGYLFAMMLSLSGVALRRAGALEQDTDGLI